MRLNPDTHRRDWVVDKLDPNDIVGGIPTPDLSAYTKANGTTSITGDWSFGSHSVTTADTFVQDIIGLGSTAMTGTGTITDDGGGGITGSGTAFTTELHGGSLIWINDTLYQVSAIIDDATMYLSQPSSASGSPFKFLGGTTNGTYLQAGWSTYGIGPVLSLGYNNGDYINYNTNTTNAYSIFIGFDNASFAGSQGDWTVIGHANSGQASGNGAILGSYNSTNALGCSVVGLYNSIGAQYNYLAGPAGSFGSYNSYTGSSGLQSWFFGSNMSDDGTSPTGSRMSFGFSDTDKFIFEGNALKVGDKTLAAHGVILNDTYFALNVSGQSQILTASGYITLGYDSVGYNLGVTSMQGGFASEMSDYTETYFAKFCSNDGAGTQWAGNFLGNGDTLTICNGSNVINAIGLSHFQNSNASNIVDIITSAGACITYEVPGWWGGTLSGSGGAGYFHDGYNGSTNEVYIADGGHAISAKGWSHFTDNTRSVDILNPNIPDMFFVDNGAGQVLSFLNAYGIQIYCQTGLGGLQGVADFFDGTNEVKIGTGSFAIDSAGQTQFIYSGGGGETAHFADASSSPVVFTDIAESEVPSHFGLFSQFYYNYSGGVPTPGYFQSVLSTDDAFPNGTRYAAGSFNFSSDGTPSGSLCTVNIVEQDYLGGLWAINANGVSTFTNTDTSNPPYTYSWTSNIGGLNSAQVFQQSGVNSYATYNSGSSILNVIGSLGNIGTYVISGVAGATPSTTNADGTAAGNFADGWNDSNGAYQNIVLLADGTYAVNAIGGSLFSSTGDLTSPYIGLNFGGYNIYSIGTIGAWFDDLNGSYMYINDGVYTINSTGSIRTDGLDHGNGPPGTINTSKILYVDDLTGIVYCQ